MAATIKKVKVKKTKRFEKENAPTLPKNEFFCTGTRIESELYPSQSTSSRRNLILKKDQVLVLD